MPPRVLASGPKPYGSNNRFLGNSNSPLIRTKSDSLGFTSYIYCKFNLENPNSRSQQCFVAPFLCISPTIPATASDFMLCLSEIQPPTALRATIFRQVCGALWNDPRRARTFSRHNSPISRDFADRSERTEQL